MFHIVKNNVRLLLSSKGVFFLTLILPILLLVLSLVVFNTQGSEQQWRIALVDDDNTLLSKEFVKSTQNSSNVYTSIEKDEAESALLDNNCDAVLVIPKGFQDAVLNNKAPDVSIKVLQGQEIAIMLQNRLNMYLNSLVQLKEIKNTDNAEQLVQAFNEIQSNGIKYEEKETGSNLSSGLYQGSGLFVYVLGMSMFIIGGLVISERQEGTLNRIKHSPLNHMSYIFAMFFTALSFLLCNLFTIFIVSKFFNSTITLPMYLLWLVYGICWIFFSIFTSLAVNSSRVYSTIISILSLVFAMIGGSFWPIWIMPDFLQRIAMATPHYWVNTAMLTLLNGEPVANTAKSFIALSGFIVLGVALCAFSLRRGKNAEVFV